MIQAYVISNETVAWFELYIYKLESMKKAFLILIRCVLNGLGSNHLAKNNFDMSVKVIYEY